MVSPEQRSSDSGIPKAGRKIIEKAGESTEALKTLGLSRACCQYTGVTISGILAATGGCFLASEAHYFTKGMTAGRGYVALAAMIFGNWKPLGMVAACVLFGLANALELASPSPTTT